VLYKAANTVSVNMSST